VKSIFPYDKFEPGDIVCCNGRGIFSGLTRLITSGAGHFFDRSICTHVGILFEIGDQLLVAEMTKNGIAVNSLEIKYRRWNEHVLCVRRPIVRDHCAYIVDMRNKIGLAIRRGLEYDFRGLVEFICSRVKDNKTRMYCSELVLDLTADHVLLEYPASLEIKILPEDIHTCMQCDTIWINKTRG